jgi:hypothetical protein
MQTRRGKGSAEGMVGALTPTTTSIVAARSLQPSKLALLLLFSVVGNAFLGRKNNKVVVTQCRPHDFTVIRFNRMTVNTCMNTDMFSVRRLFWTVVECLDDTFGPYVVSLHTQRCDNQRWRGSWRSQYGKERILTWVLCICVWHPRDLQIPT